MKTLIIFTNPKIESLNGAFLKSVIKGLENNHQPEEIQVLDLYKDEFNPILTLVAKKEDVTCTQIQR